MEQPRFYKETRTRLANVQRRLEAADAIANINIMGVAHDWSPGQRIISIANSADIITMELTRKVVQAGLEGEDSNVLAKNSFWSKLLSDLREAKDGKCIKGVEVNQTPRVAWKRFSLHHDLVTLAPSAYTVEVTAGAEACLDALLDPNEIDSFSKYHWLISDSPEAFLRVSELILAAFRSEQAEKGWPLQLNQDLTLVCYNDDATVGKDYKTTFITPPDPSLDQAAKRVREKLSDAPLQLTNAEISNMVMNVLLNYLLSPAELTEAEEIGYATNQYLRTGLKQGQNAVQTLHIGGAAHAQVVSDILRGCLPENNSRINISTSYDPRMGAPYIGHTLAFFRDHIPFADRMSAVSIQGFETAVDPEQIANQVDLAMGANGEDFEKRIVTERILEKKFDQPRGFRRFRKVFKARAELYGLSLADLKNLVPSIQS